MNCPNSGSDAEGESSRVHFSMDDVNLHNSEIVLEQEDVNRVGVHLGFLQIGHHYEVQFGIEDTLYEDLVADPLQNLNCRVRRLTPTEDGKGHNVVLEFNACKEKLMREEVTLTEARPVGQIGRSITLVLHARVLGKGKGTPSLRSGIHCLQIDEDESDQSDWQGFQ